MKRFILLGIAILCAGSMVMAADIDIDADGNLSGDYTGDVIHIGVSANANVTLDGDLTADGVVVTDTTVGAMGSLTIGAGYTANLGTFNLGTGGIGTLNVAGTLNTSGLLNYDGDGSQYNPITGVYGVVNVSGSGQINGAAHIILGGYNAAYTVDVNLSDNAIISAGQKGVYIGGIAGSGTLTMSGSAQLRNDTAATGYYDNQLNIGWSMADSGRLVVESGNTVQFRHILVKAGGTVEYILDAGGAAAVLTAAPEAGWAGESFMSWEIGSVIEIDESGVGAGILVAGYAVDIASTTEWNYLRWDTPGTFEAALSAADEAFGWALREKPGDVTTLQAYIVPEPTTMALLGLGGLLAALRRKK